MKPKLFCSIGLAVVAACVVTTRGQSEPVLDVPKEVRPLDAFMRRKLELTRDAVQGIVTEDFALIKKSAEGLEHMSRQSEWDVFHLPEYNQYSAEFRRIARTMAKRAEQKDIDAAALAYVQLTLSCVECHKFTRGVKMAQDNPTPKKP